MRTIALAVVCLLTVGCDSQRTTDGVVQTRWGELRLLIVPPLPGTGAPPEHVLVNDTTQSLLYGHPFVIERWTGDEWGPVRGPRCGFTLEGLNLEPGERSAPESLVPCGDEDDGLARGLYLVTKDVDIALGGDEWDREILTAIFVVR